MKMSRTVDVYADAAYYVLSQDAMTCSGNFYLCEDVLAEEGITDLTRYAVDPTSP